MAEYCQGCGGDIEDGLVLHRGGIYCSLACAMARYDASLANRTGVPQPAAALPAPVGGASAVLAQAR